ncbi:winged helix-turn-helix transcriptional regulator [Desemzia sp. RIT804]|uniref:PfkB family carbohydrate kinase n=1 Tax=Desemzia sp. RIT 804 TaxID=2810209 RepID=UPI00194DDD4C|nr:PfkB family carbohydrate kinase [Desemzia sp. RIT 804]MBM6614327.1 winged helix-turn-helix transcriptional regulator [Desemzia sp. RIT 804]
MALNENERKVLDVIREDPFISQQDLAEAIQLSRSAVANIISGLVKKGHLLGKAYIINEERPVVCIGAANIDNRYIVQDDLIRNTSNNIHATSSLGGVARNVAENLGRLGEHVDLISIVGNDDDWKRIKDHSKYFIDLSSVTVLDNQATGNFIEIIGKEQEVLIGLSDMSIYDCLNLDLINKFLEKIQRAKCVVVDLNCSKEAIEFLQAFTRRYNIELILITVSTQKMVNLPDQLDGITLITKHDEMEDKFQRPVQTDQELKKMVQLVLNKGAKQVVISKDSDEVIYGNHESIQIFENPQYSKGHYEWGQNEALCGAMVYANFHHYEELGYDSIQVGLINAYLTLDCLQIVRPDLTPDKLKKDIENYFITDRKI